MSGRGNILLVANWPSDVGYAWWLMENFWVAIAEHFAREGMRCVLVYPEINTIPENIANSDIEVRELDFHDSSASSRRELRRLVRDRDIRYVYLSDSPFYDLFYLRLRSWGVKRIAVHDHTPGQRTAARGVKHFAKSLVQRLPWLTADRFIAVTPFIYNRFLHVNCIPARKCSIASNGIVPIDLDAADRGYVRREFDIGNDAVIVVSVSRAAHYKGIDLMVRTAHRMVVEQGHDELVFLFCGDGPDLDDFRELAAGFALGHHMIFAGNRKDVRDILPGCDIGFHASLGEVGYSLSILEYMSAGLATVVPDLPSTQQATSDGRTGLLYRAGNLEAACEAVRRALDPDTARELGRNAVHEVGQRFEVRHTNRALLSALEQTFR